MHLSARNRIICFKIDIKDDPAMMAAMRMEPLQRYFHSRHGSDFTFAADYHLPRLQEHFKGQSLELVDIVIHKDEPHIPIKKALGAFSDALAQKTALRPEFFRQEGVSARLYRAFANNFFRLTPGYRYLELGAHDGAAFAATLYGNCLEAIAIDDWSAKGQARRSFMSNLLCVNSPASRFGMLDKQLGKIYPKTLGPRTAIFCQGSFLPPSGFLDEVLAPNQAMPAFLAVDGWNFAPRRQDWQKAIEESSFEPCLSITVRTSLDDGMRGARPGPRWGEGYHMALLTRKAGSH